MPLLLLIPAVSIATKPCMRCTWNLTVDWCEHFDFTLWVCIILLCSGEQSFLMIRFKAIVSIWWEGGGKKKEETAYCFAYINLYKWMKHLCICICLVLHKLHLNWFALRTSLWAWFNRIIFRNHWRTSHRTCGTRLSTNFGCVINHVEIKVKTEGLTLSLES